MTIDLAGIAKICEEVFDSITIYIHITSSIQNPKFYQVSFSSIPFSDPTWKDNLFHFTIGQVTEDDAEEIADLTYHRCLQAMNQFAFILTIKGHEVYTCEQVNPGEKVGEYLSMSAAIREDIDPKKPKVEILTSKGVEILTSKGLEL